MLKNLTRICLPAVVIFFLVPFNLCFAQTLAFPDAEGFGRYSTGGRGGDVYHVTNLNDSGAGSFRDAVSQSNRTVVFDVGGVIHISERVVISSNVTIAGQTSPGDGISIYGNGVSYSNANNTITRYIRYRMGASGSSGKDAIAIADGHDMIFDHVSVSWGRDGTFDINGDVSNVTVQNCIISQGLVSHSTGGLMQSSGGVSLLYNLWIDNNTRNPKVKGINEYVNNVVYNWDAAAYILGDSAGDSYANVIGNYFIYGPDTGAIPFTRGNENFHIYASDNYKDTNKNGQLDGSLIARSEYGTVDWQTSPHNHPKVSAMSPQNAFSHVQDQAGCSYPNRDEVDTRLIQELNSLGTMGELISTEYDYPMNGPGQVRSGTASIDTDGDGIPDSWEQENGLNPNNASDRNQYDDSGYTMLEVYLNSLVDESASGGSSSSGSSSESGSSGGCDGSSSSGWGGCN